jgi:hypothetical protein
LKKIFDFGKTLWPTTVVYSEVVGLAPGYMGYKMLGFDNLDFNILYFNILYFDILDFENLYYENLDYENLDFVVRKPEL